MKAIRNLECCRICGEKNLTPYLNLGLMPLVNRYLKNEIAAQDEPKFPLEVLLCQKCHLSQLSVVVAPEIMFSEYDYHSSVSKTFQHHCQRMAEDLKQKLNLTPKDLVVEIASNDGCLLSYFKQLECRVRGVEPAQNLAKLSEQRGFPTIAKFWSSDVSAEILKTDGPAKLVVATNVLAHVDDVRGFVSSVRNLLAPQGAFVFEVPYAVKFIQKTEFDTTYHEHLSYFLLKPLKVLLEASGLTMVDAEEFSIHGGSIRVRAKRTEDIQENISPEIDRLLKLEQSSGLWSLESYRHFENRTKILREELKIFVDGLKKTGKKIAAYGASAKGNILLNYCGFGKDTIDFIVDDTPSKQGKLHPGTHIPIVARDQLASAKPDYLFLLAWNFSDELIKNTPEFAARGGRYILPVPALHVVTPWGGFEASQPEA